MRTVTLVTGPPCAGKSQYIVEHAGPSDLVIDFDDIAVELGSPRRHRHAARFRDAAGTEFRRRVAMLASTSDDVELTAWVTRCAADGGERERLAAQIRASKTLLLLPPMDTLLARADERRDHVGTRLSIARWHAHHTPSEADQIAR